MAVYTHITPSDAAAWLREHYTLPPVTGLTPITQGVENSNYILDVAGTPSRYILTLYEKRVRHDDIPYYLGLMAHLGAQGLAVPAPQRRRDGALFGPLAGRQASVTSFLPGANMAEASIERLHSLGEACARLHLAGKGFAPIRANDLAPRLLTPVYTRCEGKLDALEPGLDAIIAAEVAHLAAEDPGDLPQGHIHADLFTDNVFFEGERVSGIIDFYFACTDSYVYELAVVMNDWCFKSGRLRADWLQALLAGYEQVRLLTSLEKAALPFLARGGAMRFFLTRAYDWLNRVPGALVAVKDPGEYLQKWRWHCQAKPEDYGL